MTTNRQRAVAVIPNAMRLYYPDVLDEVAAALDESEARGRAEVAAKVEWLADHIQALDVSHVKAPGLVARLRAIVAEATR